MASRRCCLAAISRSIGANSAPRAHFGVLSTRGFRATSNGLEKRYTAAHEWVELSSDGKIATFGISSYAASALGDVVFVELPAADLAVKAGDALGAVESVKSASDIYAPVEGKVAESNLALEEKPALINQSPEGDGWIAKLAVKDTAPEEISALMDATAYKKHTEEASDS